MIFNNFMYKFFIIPNNIFEVIIVEEDEKTEYGEFVCSFDKWLPIEVQKERAKKLESITKANKQKNN